MARKKRPIIKIISNGRHKGTKLFVDDIEVPFDALHFVGDKNIDYDMVISFFQSKATREGCKQAGGPDAVGFQVPSESDEWEDDDDD